jgi:hypothetical protein
MNYEKYSKIYILWLIEAIERWADESVAIEPKIFIYEGMNLRYVIERVLYIKLSNSKSLKLHYQSSIGNKGSGKINLSSELIRSSLEEGLYIGIKGNLKKLLSCFVIKWTYGWLRFVFQEIEKNKEKTKKNVKSDLIIGIIHPKFLRYIDPIVESLSPLSSACLILSSVDKKNFIELNFWNIKFSKKRRPFINHLFLNSILKENFYGIIQLADELIYELKRSLIRGAIVVEGNAPEDILYSEVCKKFSIPIFCIQQGWAPIIHNGFRNMSFNDMFVWGDEFKKLLSPLNPMQKFTAVGNHILCETSKANFQKEWGSLKISFFLQAPSPLISVEVYEAFINLAIWTARNFPHIEVLVREHPNFSIPENFQRTLKKVKNIKVSVPKNSHLAEDIKTSDLVVSIFSTVILEAISMGVVPLICNVGGMDSYGVDCFGASIEVDTIEGAKEEINKIAENPALLGSFSENLKIASDKYFYRCDSPARLIAQKIKRSIRSV